MQRSRCSEGGNQQEPDDLGTEAGIGNIVAETTLLHDCSTESTEGTEQTPVSTRLCVLCDLCGWFYLGFGAGRLP